MKKVPQSLRTWFFVHFLVDIVIALPLIVAPEAFLSLLNWGVIDPIAARLVGAALFAIGVESLWMKDSTLPAYLSMLRLKILWSSAGLIALLFGVLQQASSSAWIFIGMFTVFLCVWVYYKVRLFSHTHYVTEHPEVTEKQKDGKDITLQVGVKIFLRNTEGKYLLVHRNSETYPEVQQRWDIVGGRIVVGDELVENLTREIKEETQLDITGEVKLIFAQDILRGGDRHVVRLTYIGEALGDVVLDTEENDRYQWLTSAEMLALPDTELDQYTREVLETIDINRV
jgi:ADP-ribose pyrophosphatase YjhB (NUDIX family)